MSQEAQSTNSARFEHILLDLYAMQVQDLEEFVNKATALLEKRRRPDFSDQEQDLIKKIQDGGPDESFWKEYDLLSLKLEEETMTTTENQRFLALTDVVDKWAVKRLILIVELAGLWDSSIDHVMKYLNIQPRARKYA